MAGKVGELSKKFGIKIQFERIKRNITQDKLAYDSGLSNAALSAIENGKSSPTLETANDIAKALNITLSELIDFNKIEL